MSSGGSEEASGRTGEAAWLSVLVGAILLFGTGCSLLGDLGESESKVHSVDPNVPFVVVTVGGSPGATATLSVAETIPDSTPLPRIALPTPDPPAAARPGSTPNAGRTSAAARSGQQNGNGQSAAPASSPRVP